MVEISDQAHFEQFQGLSARGKLTHKLCVEKGWRCLSLN
jgi:hypothetical protein